MGWASEGGIMGEDEGKAGEGSTKAKRGFAAMSASERARISSLGGKAAHELGTAHVFTSEEARVAGSLGGRAFHAKSGHKMSPVTPANSGKARGKAKGKKDPE